MKKEDLEALRKIAEKIDKIISKEQIVCSKQCDQCLFSKNKIVEPKRVKEILEKCERDSTHFICHKGSIADMNVVCKGFFDMKTTPFLELMKAAGRIKFVVPEMLELKKNKEVLHKKAGKGKHKDQR